MSLYEYLFAKIVKYRMTLVLIATSLFVYILLFTAFQYYVSSWSPYAGTILTKLTDALFISVIIAIFVTVGERLYEKTNIAYYLRRELSGFERKFSDRIENLILSRFSLGLQQVIEKIDDGEIICDSSNKSVMWMNTKFNELEVSQEHIRTALLKGTNVRVLLMHKDNPCSEFRGKDSCRNPDDPESIKNAVEDYRRSLKTSQISMINFYKDMQKLRNAIDQSKDKNKKPLGSFELRFYMDLPSVPMIVVERGERHESVYTGFYLNRFSSAMPYIEWGSSNPENSFVDNLYDYFERKWKYSEMHDAGNFLDADSKKTASDPRN
ncbi:hypothetical protein LNKW23_41800 [Paralimibaculum aggregatum]|uniref:Uncharacterized protein n=1 Tax=Paralimibaculum aggregatum TaxID=3036245 RepID=A0ABQ6LP16_9RHOB|nr:hypothetical protein LNKW23_41800 [Limibaculum sp. NKW23]